MKLIPLSLLFCWMAVSAYGQDENLFAIVFDPVAKKRLDAVHIKDWQYRKYLMGMKDATRDSLAKAFGIKADKVEEHLQTLQAVNDTENLAEVASVIWGNESYYPGISLVGKPTHLVALSVILHTNQKQKYFPRVNQAFIMGELPETAVVTLEDHIIIETGRPQNYGTHFTPVKMRDTVTKKMVTRYYISPIHRPDYVNDMRKSVGFDQTVEQYAKQIGAIYDPTLTIEKLEQLRETGKVGKK